MKPLLKLRLSCFASFSWNLEHWKVSTEKANNLISINFRHFHCLNHSLYYRTRKKLGLLYLCYHKASDHQTWQGGDLLWESSTHKVTQPFEIVVKWVHVINKKYFSLTTLPIFTASGGVVTYNEELPKIMSQDPLIMQPHMVTWQTEYSISPLWLWSPHLTGWLHTIRFLL